MEKLITFLNDYSFAFGEEGNTEKIPDYEAS